MHVFQIESIQTQMSSKGGYEHVSPVDVQLDVIDLPAKLNGELLKCMIFIQFIYTFNINIFDIL